MRSLASARLASSVLAGSALSALSATAAYGAPETASASDSLVASTGVNTHFTYDGTPYTSDYAQVKPLLLASGLRVIREATLGDPSTLSTKFVPAQNAADLASAGVHVNFLCDLNSVTPETCVALVKAFNALYPGAVTSVEGPNEPDGFWSMLYPSGYEGQGFPAGSIQWQKDMYAAFKADTATAAIPVYGIALGLAGQPPCSNPNPLGDAGELSAYVDFGNFHPYPSGDPWHPDFAYDFVESYYHQTVCPSFNLDPNPGPGLQGFDDDTCEDQKPYGTKPMVATETGIQTTTGGIPEDHQAALVPRIILENYRLGIVHSLLYELADSGGQTFGLLRSDATPRPSYVAVKALLTRLADPGASFAPAALDYDLTLTPVTVDAGDASVTFDKLNYVHHLLFEKRDGVFELVLWHEIATDETYPSYVSLSPPVIPGVLTLNQAFATGTVTTIDATGAPTTASVDVTKPIAVSVNERFQIIELVPASLASGVDGGTDSGLPSDAAVADGAVGTDAASNRPDGGTSESEEASAGSGGGGGSGGCGCTTAGETGRSPLVLCAGVLGVLGVLAFLRRRRGRRVGCCGKARAVA